MAWFGSALKRRLTIDGVDVNSRSGQSFSNDHFYSLSAIRRWLCVRHRPTINLI